MKGKRDMRKILAVFFIFMILLTACGKNTKEQLKEADRLVLATFDNNVYLEKQIELYNRVHEDYQIEIQKYERSDILEKDGILKLQREIVSGKGPDIIDFGSEYTTSDIVGEYTENLFPYIEEEKKSDYFENVWKAFSYKENLYATPLGFTMKSFVGTKKNLENRSSWTIDEMLDCYGRQKKEKSLYPGETKTDVFGTILTGSMEYYIDWETGRCDFDGAEFCKVLEFCNSFPDYLRMENDFSVKQAFLDDKVLLLPINLRTVYDICRTELIFNNQEVTFIGFPVEGTCGTVLQSCGPVLAISRGSRKKEAAWEFISWCLNRENQEKLPSGFPICRSVFEEQLKEAMEMEYELNENGESSPVIKQQVVFEGEEPVDIFCITQKQAEQLRLLIEATEITSSIDYKIYNIFWEEAEYYFNGSKELEETADIIQAKVFMYVNERIK